MKASQSSRINKKEYLLKSPVIKGLLEFGWGWYYCDIQPNEATCLIEAGIIERKENTYRLKEEYVTSES